MVGIHWVLLTSRLLASALASSLFCNAYVFRWRPVLIAVRQGRASQVVMHVQLVFLLHGPHIRTWLSLLFQLCGFVSEHVQWFNLRATQRFSLRVEGAVGVDLERCVWRLVSSVESSCSSFLHGDTLAVFHVAFSCWITPPLEAYKRNKSKWEYIGPQRGIDKQDVRYWIQTAGMLGGLLKITPTMTAQRFCTIGLVSNSTSRSNDQNCRGTYSA